MASPQQDVTRAPEQSGAPSRAGGVSSIEPSWPEVVRRMIDSNNSACEFAPLGENLLRVQQVKAGTQITLGIPGARVAALMHGEYVGGLLLIRRAEYDRVLAELLASEPQP